VNRIPAVLDILEKQIALVARAAVLEAAVILLVVQTMRKHLKNLNDAIDVVATDDLGSKPVIIHIDVDHFYSQVEEVLNPEIKEKPVGILQRNFIVTCNYIGEYHQS
jgi:hypothetical protein